SAGRQCEQAHSQRQPLLGTAASEGRDRLQARHDPPDTCEGIVQRAVFHAVLEVRIADAADLVGNAVRHGGAADLGAEKVVVARGLLNLGTREIPFDIALAPGTHEEAVGVFSLVDDAEKTIREAEPHIQISMKYK